LVEGLSRHVLTLVDYSHGIIIEFAIVIIWCIRWFKKHLVMLFALSVLLLASFPRCPQILFKLLIIRWYRRRGLATDQLVKGGNNALLTDLSIHWRLDWVTHSIEHDHVRHWEYNTENVIQSMVNCNVFNTLLPFSYQGDFKNWVEEVGYHELADECSIHARLLSCTIDFFSVNVRHMCFVPPQ
jgi:hypothetical protein